MFVKIQDAHKFLSSILQTLLSEDFYQAYWRFIKISFSIFPSVSRYFPSLMHSLHEWSDLQIAVAHYY